MVSRLCIFVNMATSLRLSPLLAILILHNVFGAPRIDPLVETNVGLIRGLRATDGEYSMFLGIPYGTVDPENPFGPSTTHPEFENTFEAFDDSAICPQIEEFNKTITGKLDCLHLNVYVPNSASSRNRLPVLVWIYGGGYNYGFSGRYLYGPKYLVRHDVILVTVNYRLGPYGFMCLDTPEVPGNQGLKDQLLALRWINSNIQSFGGDLNKVTVFGESAGARSVDFHLHSSQEKLFSSVILESGAALYPGFVTEGDRSVPVKLAQQLGYVANDYTDALSFLKTVDSNLVIAAASQIDRLFPCVEKEFDNVERLIVDYAVNERIPKARNMPILLGINNNEMISTYGNMPAESLNSLDEFNARLKSTFDFDDSTLTDMEKIVRRFYIGDDKISEDTRFEITDFASDVQYNHPAERSVLRYIENGAANVYFYVFSYNGGRNFNKRLNNITVGGAAHADELGYLFDFSLWKEEPAAEDQLIIDRMTTLWTNFVKYNNPTPETTDLLPVKWVPIVKDSFNYLDIDLDLSVKKRPFKERMAFWDLFYNINWSYQVGYKEE